MGYMSLKLPCYVEEGAAGKRPQRSVKEYREHMSQYEGSMSIERA